MGSGRPVIKSLISLFFLVAFASTFSGCASYFDKYINRQKTEDLVQTFELSQEVSDKFKVEDLQEAPVDNKASEENNTALEEVNKSTKKVAKNKTSTRAKSKAKKAKEETKQSTQALPHDYPEDLKKLADKVKTTWQQFKPISRPGENMVIEVSFLGIKVGNLAVSQLPTVIIAGREALHYKVRFKTERFYESFYKIDDTLESFVLKENHLPLRYSLIQRESGQSVDDLQLFDYDKLKTYHWYKKLKNETEKKEEKEEWIPPYVQDALSAMQFARGLPLEKGKVYEFPVMNRAKLWMTKITIVGPSEAKYGKNWLKAIKVKIENTLLENKEKKTVVEFWYSDDADKKLLKFLSKLKIGSVEGVLLSYENGQEATNGQ